MIRFVFIWVLCCGLSACIGTRHYPEADPSPSPSAGSGSTSTAKTNPYVVFGQRYYPIKDATGYRKRGVASWYGGKFHGRKTANGERYDMHQLTAAHTTLPLPTWVKVTNLRNGATVTVRVNDRGPFVKNRLIDLSYAAAQQLGMVEDGTTLVEIEAIPTGRAEASPPVHAAIPATATAPVLTTSQPVITVAIEPNAETTVTPSSTATTVTANSSGTTFAADSNGTTFSADSASAATNPVKAPATIYVQVGAFGERGNAERLQTSLYNAGIDEVRLDSGALEGMAVHRVQIGPVIGVLEYDILIARLESIGISDTHLVTD